MPERNDPCPCGSGKKYKQCCIGRTGRSAVPAAAANAAPKRAPNVASKNAPATGRIAKAIAEAEALAGRGQDAEAMARFETVLAKRPREVRALLGLGRLRDRARRTGEAIALLERAIAAGAAGAAQYVQLGVMTSIAGRLDKARDAAERAVAIDDQHAPAWVLRAMVHERFNEIDDATAAIERALTLDSKDRNAPLIHARLLRRNGRLEDACARIEEFLADRGEGRRSMGAGYHEYGQILDQLGRYEDAWEAFERAGREDEGAAAKVDRDEPARRFASYRRHIWPGVLPSADAAPTGRVPTFLVGFARSGTTMLEQMLGAHPTVVTSDEKQMVNELVGELCRRRGSNDIGQHVASLDDGERAELREFYWKKAEEMLATSLDGRHLVDKNPFGLIDLPMINAVFPDARVILLTRDPRDVCLSCMMQHFKPNPAMVHFNSIRSTVAFYDAVMTYVQAIREHLTVDVLDVCYEDVVTNFEEHARRVLEFAGLPWDPVVLRFQEKAKKRLISTPSFAAVIQAVNARAVGRWRRYEKAMVPELPVLAPYVKAFGYGDAP